MARIVKLTDAAPSTYGYERARKERPEKRDGERQLPLFHGKKARIVELPTGRTAFDEAYQLDEEGKLDLAAQVYEKAIGAGDSPADAYSNLGIIRNRMGDLDGAFENFLNALKENPDHLEAHYNLGNYYAALGELRSARLHYEVAASINPAFPNVYFNLALLYAGSGKIDEALKALGTFRDLASEEGDEKADRLLVLLEDIQRPPSSG